MEAYPLSVRRRIITLYEKGLRTEQIAEVFGYCVAGVRRVRQRFAQTGSVEPKAGKVGRKPAFDPAALRRLSDAVRQKPDATLAELRDTVGVKADLAVYCRTLARLNLTRKKSRSTLKSKSVRT